MGKTLQNFGPENRHFTNFPDKIRRRPPEVLIIILFNYLVIHISIFLNYLFITCYSKLNIKYCIFYNCAARRLGSSDSFVLLIAARRRVITIISEYSFVSATCCYDPNYVYLKVTFQYIFYVFTSTSYVLIFEVLLFLCILLILTKCYFSLFKAFMYLLSSHSKVYSIKTVKRCACECCGFHTKTLIIMKPSVIIVSRNRYY
jgi:hypothetical protein